MDEIECQVDDTALVLAEKIDRFVDRCTETMRDTVCRAAQQRRKPIGLHSEEFHAGMALIPMRTGHATAEWLLPRAIIGRDEKHLLDCRAAMDLCLRLSRPDLVNRAAALAEFGLAPDAKVPVYHELPEMRTRALIEQGWASGALSRDVDEDGAVAWANWDLMRRRSTCDEWHRLNAAWQRLESVRLMCAKWASRPCARSCGAFGPLKECELCERFYCSDSCRDGHTELGQCIIKPRK